MVDNPAKFYKVMLQREDLYSLTPNNLVLRVLDELERLVLKDLLDFMQFYNIRLPKGRKEEILQKILSKPMDTMNERLSP